jgi:hypothetical protein
MMGRGQLQRDRLSPSTVCVVGWIGSTSRIRPPWTAVPALSPRSAITTAPDLIMNGLERSHMGQKDHSGFSGPARN